MADPAIRDVPDTAFLVAGFRALETERPDALFRDPLAARLAGDKGREILAAVGPRSFIGGWTMVIRTVIIDRMITEAIAGGVDTVVNLGAGLDARPYRLDLPADLRWIEVDLPRILEWKTGRLEGEAPRCHLERRAVDLADDDARRALLDEVCAGDHRILVLTEGVILYLAEASVGALADDLRARPQVTGWIVDYMHPAIHARRERGGHARHMSNAPFRFHPADWERFFAAHGWRVDEMRYLAPEGRRLGRPFPLPRMARILGVVRRALTPRARRVVFDQFAGYARLAPAPKEDQP